MNRTEYMDALQVHLRRLPKEDLHKALEYFDEYFSDAGPENEARAIEDLGSPETAAEQIITNLAISNSTKPVKGVKKGAHAVWVGVLSVFAAPIALPLGVMLAAVALMIVVVMFLLVACLFLSGALLVINGPVSIAAGITVITTHFWVFVSSVGLGLMSAGLGILVLVGMTLLSRQIINGLVRFFGRIARKGGKKHE